DGSLAKTSISHRSETRRRLGRANPTLLRYQSPVPASFLEAPCAERDSPRRRGRSQDTGYWQSPRVATKRVQNPSCLCPQFFQQNVRSFRRDIQLIFIVNKDTRRSFTRSDALREFNGNLPVCTGSARLHFEPAANVVEQFIAAR